MSFWPAGYFLLPETLEQFLLEGAEDHMSFFFTRNLIALSRRSCKMILSFLWCFGFSCGILTAARADNLASLMLACCDAGVSIVGLFFVPFIPFLISAAAVYISAPLILYLTGLCKSFLLGFCVCAVCMGFSVGGWLMCLLFLFTDLLTAPALFWFQLRCVSGYTRDILRNGLFALLWFMAVSIVDCMWIVPLLRDII